MSPTDQARARGHRAVAVPLDINVWPDWLLAVAICLVLGVALLGSALLGPIAFWVTYVLTLAGLAFILWWLRGRPAVVVTALLTWFAVHKVFVAWLAPAIGPQTTVWLQNYKELMYLLLFAIGALAVARPVSRVVSRTAARRLLAADWIAIAFLTLVTVYFAAALAASLASGPSLQAALIYARRFASLPIIFLAGRLLLADRAGLRRTIGYLVVVAVVVAVFGIIERLILGDQFWTDFVRVGQFQDYGVQEGIASSRARLVDGLPATWFAFMEGATIRRLVASFLEPTTLAMFLGLVFGLAAFAMPEWRQRARAAWVVALIVIGTALLLTIGKGGYMIVAIVSIIVLARTSRRSAVTVALLVGALGLAILGLVQVLPIGSNVDRHLSGLASGVGLSFEQPLGTGLGSTGFWGTRGTVGNDSTLGAVASQLGLLGVALYYGWLGAASWHLLPSASGTDAWDLVRRTIAASVIALLAVSVMSNSASGLLAGSFYVILAGWAITADRMRQTSSPGGKHGS